MKAKRYEVTFRWLKKHCAYIELIFYEREECCHDDNYEEDGFGMPVFVPCTEANCPLLKRRKQVSE